MDGNGCKFMACIGRWYTKPTRTYPRRTSLRRAILCCYSLATFCASNGLQKLLVEVLDGKFFFFAFPSCQQSGNFIKKHGRCTEKTHHGLLPVTIMSVRWWYFSGALDCGLPWRPTQVKWGESGAASPFHGFYHTSNSQTKLVSLWHQSFDVRWKPCKISTLA